MKESDQNTHRNNSPDRRRPGAAETIVDGLNSFFSKIVRLLIFVMVVMFFLGVLVQDYCTSNVQKGHHEGKPAAFTSADR